MQSLLALTVLLSLGLCWARPSESGPEVVSAEYIREMAARNAQGNERRQLGDMEEVDEPGEFVILSNLLLLKPY